MERIGIGNTGFMLAMPEGYSRESTNVTPHCLLALRSPSKKIAIYIYDYPDEQSLGDQLQTLTQQLEANYQAFAVLQAEATSETVTDPATSEAHQGGAQEASHEHEEPAAEPSAAITLTLDTGETPTGQAAPSQEPEWEEAQTTEETPEEESETLRPIQGELIEKCGEDCAYLEYGLGPQPEIIDARYAAFAGFEVRSCLFQKGAATTRFDFIYTPDSRRRTDALLSNIAAINR